MRKEQDAGRMVDLYWLGYLLTGDRERAVRTVIEVLDLHDAANPFFQSWMVQWSRKIFISKVIGRMVPETGPSALRTQLKRLQASTKGLGQPNLGPGAGKAELERALLAIEPFPRCAVVLSVFEKLAIPDVATLLNSDCESVKTATAIGLIQLSRNLAGDPACGIHRFTGPRTANPAAQPASAAILCRGTRDGAPVTVWSPLGHPRVMIPVPRHRIPNSSTGSEYDL